jgi:hypothetical protein
MPNNPSKTFGSFNVGSTGFCLDGVDCHLSSVAIVACWQASNLRSTIQK